MQSSHLLLIILIANCDICLSGLLNTDILLIIAWTNLFPKVSIFDQKIFNNFLLRKLALHLVSGWSLFKTVVERRTLNKLLSIMDKNQHPLHHTVVRQRSTFSHRLLQLCCRRDRYRKSFLPHAITLFNKSWKHCSSAHFVVYRRYFYLNLICNYNLKGWIVHFVYTTT